MDTIFIRDLRAEAWIGVYEWEKLSPANAVARFDHRADTHAAGASDNICDTG